MYLCTQTVTHSVPYGIDIATFFPAFSYIIQCWIKCTAIIRVYYGLMIRKSGSLYCKILKWFQVLVLDYLYTLLKFVQIPLIQEMISLSNFSHVSLFPPSMICSGSAAGLAGFAGTENLSNMYVWLMNNETIYTFAIHVK